MATTENFELYPKYYELVTALMKDGTFKILWGARSDNNEYIYTEYSTNLVFKTNEVINWEYVPKINNLKID